MTEELTGERVVGQTRNAVVSAVLTEGLKSAATLINEGREYLGSEDTIARGHVSGALVDPSTNISVEDALYSEGDSVFPVLVERKGENYFFAPKPHELPKFENRTQSSFLVLWRKKPDETFTSRAVVPPEEMMSLVFPREVWDGLPEDIREKIEIPVVVVEDMVQRKVSGPVYGAELSVPNYEEALRRIWEQNHEPFLVHGVRLPAV